MTNNIGSENIQEKIYAPISGWTATFLAIGMIIGGISLMRIIASPGMEAAVATSLMVIVSVALGWGFGLIVVRPNQARVLLLFGEYKGSVKSSGFFFVNPFFSKIKLSLRIRNFQTGSTEAPNMELPFGLKFPVKGRTQGEPSKVNDRDGNPMEIAAVVVWRIVDTAAVLFEIDDFDDFVSVQSEAALRNLATRHPYDSEDHEVSLRGNTPEIGDQLRADIHDRLANAGVEIIEAQISHLAYAPEIASVMLKRQQAQAVIAARSKIVEGAVTMVEKALSGLSDKNIVKMDEERKAAMVSNLLVVLCSDSNTQPVINTGSLYQ